MSVFSKIIVFVKGLFGGKAESAPSSEGHSEVYLPEDRSKGGKRRRDNAQKRQPRPQEASRKDRNGRPQKESARPEKPKKTAKPLSPAKQEAPVRQFDENWQVPERRCEKQG